MQLLFFKTLKIPWKQSLPYCKQGRNTAVCDREPEMFLFSEITCISIYNPFEYT